MTDEDILAGGRMKRLETIPRARRASGDPSHRSATRLTEILSFEIQGPTVSASHLDGFSLVDVGLLGGCWRRVIHRGDRLLHRFQLNLLQLARGEDAVDEETQPDEE